MGWLGGQMAACRQEGFPGLRVAVDMSWALRPLAGIEQLPDFEAGIANALAGTMVSVLCQYDRERFDPVTLASVAACHTRLVAAATYHADAVLRICRQYAPPGIRLAGGSTTRPRSRWRWLWPRPSGWTATSPSIWPTWPSSTRPAPA